MVFENGSIQHLKPIAKIYREAFPESIQLFFAGKDPGKLLRLLTNAFTFLYLTGARFVIARRADSGQVLGYCVYSSPTRHPGHASCLWKNLGQIMKLTLAFLRDLHFTELVKLTANAIQMRFHRRVDQRLPRRCSRIISIAVRPAAQGHGIGKELLTRALKELSAENVTLNVRPDNAAAFRLYQNTGFSVCGSSKDLQGPWLMMIRRA
ncbi:MAG: N-acetyltransferase [Limnochordia bacterium]